MAGRGSRPAIPPSKGTEVAAQPAAGGPAEKRLRDPAGERLRDIESITDAALSFLDEHELLTELLDRIRGVLQVDTAAVLLLDPSASELVATAAVGLEEEVVQGVRVPVGAGFAGRIAAEGRPVVLDQVDHTTVANPILLAKGIRTMLGVPLRAGGKVIGVMHVGSLQPRAFTGEDKQLLRMAADRAASTVESLLARDERIAAAALQRSLLPFALPAVAGAEVAARYVAGKGAVGGDWYDVFTLPSGQLGLVIGDVAGSGLPAAVIMGRMRSSLRAYALDAADPGEALARLDRKMRHFEPGAMASVLYAVAEPGLGRVQIASAGHLPPMLAAPGQPAAPAAIKPGLMIGAGAAWPGEVTSLDIPPGGLLCLYTDGLVERPGRSIDKSLAALAGAITAQRAEAACAAVMSAMVGSDPPRDDIALLMIHRVAEREPARPQASAKAEPARSVTYPLRWQGPAAILTLPGDIDVTNQNEVSQELARLVARRPAAMVVDLTGTAFCDSSGAVALVRTAEQADAAGVALALAASAAVRRILGLLMIDHLVDVHDTVDAALAAASAGPSSRPAPAD